MGLPQIGVEAVVSNLDGYKNGIKSIESATSEAAGSITKATGQFEAFGGVTSHLGNIIDVAFGNVMASAINTATSAIGGFISGIGEAARSQQLVEAQLQSVLKSTKGAAGVTAQEVNRMADSLSNLTKFSDDEIVSAQNMLLTFTNIKSDVFPQATQTVLDMSQALGQDLKSSSIQLGKALNNPIQGITALQRVGVTFTAKQKEMIANFVAMGDTASAQKVILTELATEFGGSAEAAATPWDRLQNRLQKFQATIGEAFIPAIDGALKALEPFINEGLKQASDFLENVVGPAFAKTGAVISDFFVFLTKGNEGPLQAFGDALVQQFPAGTIHDIGIALHQLGDALFQLGPAGTIAAGGAVVFGALLAKALVGSVIDAVAGSIASLAGSMIAAAGGALLAAAPFIILAGAVALLVGVVTNFPEVVKIFSSGGALGGIGDAVRQAANDVAVAAGQLALKITLGFADVTAKIEILKTNIATAATNLLTPIITAFTNLTKEPITAIGQLAAAIEKLPDSVAKAVQGIITNFEPARNLFDQIASAVTGTHITTGGNVNVPAGLQGTGGATAQPSGRAGMGVDTSGRSLETQVQVQPPTLEGIKAAADAGTAQAAASGAKIEVPIAVKPLSNDDFTKAVVDPAVAGISAATPALQGAGSGASTAIANGAKSASPTVSTNLQQGIKDGQAWIASTGVGLMSGAGGAIIAGLIGGINSNAGGVEAALSGIITAAVAKIKAQLGIASPSKVFAGIGGQMMTGWEKGINMKAGLPTFAVSAVAENVIGAAGSSQYNDNSNTTTNYYLGLQPYQSGNDNALQLFRS